MTKEMIATIYNLLEKNEFIGVTNRSVAYRFTDKIISALLGIVKTKMPIPNVDDNIKSTTLKDLAKPPTTKECLTTTVHCLYTLGEGGGPSESAKFLERGL